MNMSLWYVHAGSSARVAKPTLQIPTEVTDYYLQRVGFECQDVRLWVAGGPSKRTALIGFLLGNGCLLSQPRSLCPTLPLMHINTLVYVRTLQVVVLE